MYYHSALISKLNSIIYIFFRLQQLENYAVRADVEDISNDLEPIRVKRHLTGLSALAIKNGKLVGQGAAGYRRQNTSSSLLISDSVNIGSCSKWMTATLAGRLVDRKFLSWSTKVYECFPNYHSFNSAFHNATLEQLLAHRAGVQTSPTFYDRHGLSFVSQQGNINKIRRWVAETVLKDVPEIQPGEYLYSNPGYTVAAAMMESVTGRDWESLMQEHVFTPLAMTSARIDAVYNDALPPKAPVGHDLAINSTTPVPRPMLTSHLLHIEHASIGPSGFIACTLHDWAKFLRAHIVAEAIGYLSKETANKLKSPFIGTDGYGLGVIVFNRTWSLPGQALMHNGDVFGQNTVFWVAPAKDLVAVAYTNCCSEDNASWETLDAAIGILLQKYLK